MSRLPPKRRKPTNRGFTLLEILVALAIAATGITAMVTAISDYAGRTITLETKLYSAWVASNRLAELSIGRAWPAAGRSEGSSTMAGRTWYFSEEITTTSEPEIARVDITVYSDEDREVETGFLFGYLQKP